MFNLRKIKQDWIYLGVVICWPLILFLRKLGLGPLSGNDEIIYAGVAKKILITGDWLTMHYKDIEWFHKPPLLMWLTASAYLGFGTSTFTTRLTSALAGVAACIVLYLLGKKLFDRNTGLIAALVLATNQFVLQYGRQGMTDTLLTLFCLVAIYAYLFIKDNPKAWWLSWAALGFSVMTKGAAAAPVLAIFALVVLYDQGFKFLKNRDFWIGAGVFIAIVVPWHLAMIYLHGDFIQEYLGYHVIKRAELPIEGHTGGVLYYAKILWHLFYPWTILGLIGALVFFKKLFADKKNMGYVIPLVGTIVVIGFYTIVKTKLDWYIIPAIPFIALMIGNLFVSAAKKFSSYEYLLVILATLYLALNQKPKSQLLFGVIILLTVIVRKQKHGAAISTYALFAWTLFLAVLSIRAIVL